jgi:hypothetical protein
MKKYIATYFYHDCEDQGAIYGNIFLPLDKRNIVYWQTVYTLYFSSIVENKNSDINYVLFTNVPTFPFRSLIESLGVKVYDDLSLTLRNPYKWATVKFFFDVIEFIRRSNDFKDDDAFVMLDTDVVAIKSVKPLFDFLHTSKNAIAYAFDELSGKDKDFHGVNISNLEKIGLSALRYQINIKKLIGGEFFCFNKYQITEFTKYFDAFKNSDYSDQITTEEQILTLINARESWAFYPEGICRVWTTLRVFKIPKKYLNCIFLHLPAEKELALNKLFHATKDIDPNKIKTSDYRLIFYRCIPLNNPYFLYFIKLKSKISIFFRQTLL